MKNLLIVCLVLLSSCVPQNDQVSNSGVQAISASVSVNANGMTVEQENVKRRLETDNTPGSLKYVYCISSYSGEVIFQSTAKGKVTSSGKRLSPVKSFVGNGGGYNYAPNHSGQFVTDENIQDDGTFGSSIEYVYWWDVNDVYTQHYITGGQIFVVRSQPMTVNRVSIDMNVTTK